MYAVAHALCPVTHAIIHDPALIMYAVLHTMYASAANSAHCDSHSVYFDSCIHSNPALTMYAVLHTLCTVTHTLCTVTHAFMYAVLQTLCIVTHSFIHAFMYAVLHTLCTVTHSFIHSHAQAFTRACCALILCALRLIHQFTRAINCAVQPQFMHCDSHAVHCDSFIHSHAHCVVQARNNLGA